MSEPILTTDKPNTLISHTKKVMCDGQDWDRHPRVYLTMVDDANGNPEHVVCPYCSKVYRYAAPKHGGDESH